MVENVKEPGSIQTGDIVFDCPHCGKSLAIDQRGASYFITCPDCKNEVQVPSLDDTEEIHVGDTQNLPAEQKNALDELQAQINRLEQQRIRDRERMKTISDEMGVMQSSLDRITTLIQDAYMVDAEISAKKT